MDARAEPEGGGMTTFSAADSALGYLYQVRVALLWSLRRARAGADFVVSLETLDDVTFESIQATGPTPDELLQTKHHRKSEASLSDASGDLWKSLRVWFEGRANNTIPSGTALYLLTTGAAPKDGAAWFLRSDGARDVGKALRILEAVTQTSQSDTNAKAYAAFLTVPVAMRKALLENVVVLDRSPTVATIDEDIKKEVRWSAAEEHLDAFAHRLEGWWSDRIIKQLADPAGAAGIQGTELDHAIDELREQFKPENLPIDNDLVNYILDERTETAHAESPFVHQLKLVAAKDERVARAIRNYYRAFEQRSRWMREHLLLVGELTRYDGKLVEEWEQAFLAAKDEISTTAAEGEKQKLGRQILSKTDEIRLPVRPDVTESFVVLGSFQMLADEAKVGWHPDYRDLLTSFRKPSQPGTSDEGGDA
jgi:hypothetical protein